MLLALIGIGVGYSWVGGNTQNLQRARIEAETFARVKEALIGWSVSRTESTCPPCERPGELPCPDANNDGDAEASCVAGAVRRVPWKTLGIDAPNDSARETLWYAIAGPFRNWGHNHDPIHSDTKGNITVYQGSAASTVTSGAIAVLFAPGASLGAQNRTTAATACPTTGSSIAGNLCAATYLDTAASVSNAATNGPYISGQASGAFNDKLMVIKTTDLMPIVEPRVAREVRSLLQQYKIATGFQGYNGGAGV